VALTGTDWIDERLTRLEALLRREDYRGWDPFDLPNAPLLARVPASWWLPQLVMSKVGSRLVGDRGRRLLRVPPIEDPKICACAYAGYRFGGLPGGAERAAAMADRVASLATLQEGGRRAWGYDYVWATRASGVNPRGASTIVPGSFAALTLLHHAVDTGERRHLALLEEALDHYAECHATRNDSGPFLGYFQGVSANTHNANLLGCTVLTLAAGVLDRPDWLPLAAAAAATTIAAVRPDGYLAYADQPSGEWTDCFHHLYVIACAATIARANPHADRATFEAAVERLWGYARAHFMRPDGLVNYFPDRVHPIDPHNYAAAAIFSVMAGQGDATELLRRVDERMWDPARGLYAYKRHARRTDRRTFLRWTQAWMFAALAIATAGEAFREHASIVIGAPTPAVN
jgi:hypothetical protein